MTVVMVGSWCKCHHVTIKFFSIWFWGFWRRYGPITPTYFIVEIYPPISRKNNSPSPSLVKITYHHRSFHQYVTRSPAKVPISIIMNWRYVHLERLSLDSVNLDHKFTLITKKEKNCLHRFFITRLAKAAKLYTNQKPIKTVFNLVADASQF